LRNLPTAKKSPKIPWSRKIGVKILDAQKNCERSSGAVLPSPTLKEIAGRETVPTRTEQSKNAKKPTSNESTSAFR
jgi:hypothetical protein